MHGQGGIRLLLLLQWRERNPTSMTYQFSQVFYEARNFGGPSFYPTFLGSHWYLWLFRLPLFLVGNKIYVTTSSATTRSSMKWIAVMSPGVPEEVPKSQAENFGSCRYKHSATAANTNSPTGGDRSKGHQQDPKSYLFCELRPWTCKVGLQAAPK